MTYYPIQYTEQFIVVIQLAEACFLGSSQNADIYNANNYADELAEAIAETTQ